jgi:hypothetical protein
MANRINEAARNFYNRLDNKVDGSYSEGNTDDEATLHPALLELFNPLEASESPDDIVYASSNKFAVQMHGCISIYRLDGDDWDVYYLPLRSLFSCVGKESVAVAIPDSNVTQKFVHDFILILKEVFDERPPLNVAWVGYNLGDADTYELPAAAEINYADFYRQIVDFARGDDSHLVMQPYFNTPAMQNLIARLRHDFESAGSASVPMHTHATPYHRALGRHIGLLGYPGPAEVFGLPYAPSIYGSQDLAAMSQAFEYLEDVTEGEVWVKPFLAASGYMLGRVDSAQELAAHMQRLREEYHVGDYPIELQADLRRIYPQEDGWSLSWHSTQFEIGDRSIEVTTPGGYTTQILTGEHGDHYAGNGFNVSNGRTDFNGRTDTAAINRKIYSIVERYVAMLRSIYGQAVRGPAGLDIFRAVNTTTGEEEVGLVEMNMRYNGAQPGIELAELLDVDDKPSMLISIPAKIPDDFTNRGLWDVLKGYGLAFDRSRSTGAMPTVWFPGFHQIFLVADSAQELREMYRDVAVMINAEVGTDIPPEVNL